MLSSSTQNLIALPPIFLPRLTAYLVVCHLGQPAPTLWVVWFYGFSAHACFVYFYSWSARQSVSATVTAVSEPSVSAVVSVTAMTGLQLRRHFQLRPKPNKTGFGRSIPLTPLPSTPKKRLDSRAFGVQPVPSPKLKSWLRPRYKNKLMVDHYETRMTLHGSIIAQMYSDALRSLTQAFCISYTKNFCTEGTTANYGVLKLSK